MSAFRIAGSVLILLCAACGNDRTVVTVLTPLAESRDLLKGHMPRRLQLDSGAGLELGSAQQIGDWVCGHQFGPGPVCISAARVKAVEHHEIQGRGPGDRATKGFALVFFAPILGIYALDDAEEQREDEADLRERLADAHRVGIRRAAARGEPAPPPPTPATLPLHEGFEGLATCLDIRQTVDRDPTDGATLAGQVWKARSECLGWAAKWYLAAGEVDRARRLTFVLNARERFEDLACGYDDPGLDLPDDDLVTTSPVGWVGEYRVVVADRATYDYQPGNRVCRGGSTVPDLTTGMAKAVADFPLTDLPPH